MWRETCLAFCFSMSSIISNLTLCSFFSFSSVMHFRMHWLNHLTDPASLLYSSQFLLFQNQYIFFQYIHYPLPLSTPSEIENIYNRQFYYPIFFMGLPSSNFPHKLEFGQFGQLPHLTITLEVSELKDVKRTMCVQEVGKGFFPDLQKTHLTKDGPTDRRHVFGMCQQFCRTNLGN